MAGRDPEREIRSDARASRKAILKAARELLASRGPEALQVAEVARRGGVNRSTAYQHFKSREDLLAAVLRDFLEEVGRLFARARGFDEQVDFFSQYFLDQPDFARIWLQQLIAETPPEPGQMSAWAAYVEQMERLARSPRTREGIDAESLSAIAVGGALLWSLLVRRRTSSKEEARLATGRFAREMKRLFLYGVLRPEDWPELVEGVDPESG
jgi:AcrR family transcriptional regulator